jgi:elongation factor G
MSGTAPAATGRPRSVALVGPYGSGKSTLFEGLTAAAGGTARRGSPRSRVMSTMLRVGHCTYLGDPWAILDCPGSIEFSFEAASAIAVADLAVVVCEPAPERALAVAPVIKTLEAEGVPYLVFVNKIDTFTGTVRDTMAALQAYCKRPLVLRHVPIREGETVTGYIDVVSERAYRYREGEPSELMSFPQDMRAEKDQAFSGLVEVLADHDDALLEKILEDVTPSPAEIFRQLRKDQASGGVVEVLIGAAERQQGLRRLWKALRHDGPDPLTSAARRGIDPEGEPLAQVFKTIHAGHTGKLSYARVWRGTIRDGATLNGQRLGGIYKFIGDEPTKVAEAEPGDVVALGRLETVATGDTLSPSGNAEPLPFPTPPEPVYSLCIHTEDRKDDVKLSGALQRLTDEDPSLTIEHDQDTSETILKGQGEMHLRALVDRLAKASNLHVSVGKPQVPFKETIRRPVHQHGRLKRQTGGHGQFADVKLDIEPLARGEGFRFIDKVVGGAVPRNYIPAVGEAAEAATRKGPFGYPVVDVSVTLVDGQFHSVDSSDMAFKTATSIAMKEGLQKADPILLEPIDHVTVSVPSEYTPSVQRVLSGRRGRILGYAEKPGWPGWDEVEALVPQAEMHDLIIELRSQTMGLGTFRRHFDHLAEARGPLAEKVMHEAMAAAR